MDKATDDGATPLYVACHLGLPVIVGLLVSAGASVDKAAKNGETPLFIACHQGLPNIVELLVSDG